MTPRTIHLLHVEDDKVQRMLTAHHLKTLKEFDFAITCAESEDEAVSFFDRGDQEFVILDYHLTRGNGLSCLRSLRQRHGTVPIIAVSGEATPAIAAELLQSGADDYIAKRDLNSDVLARSVRMALARADAWRRRAELGRDSPTHQLLKQLCQEYVARIGSDFPGKLDAFQESARKVTLRQEQLHQAFDAVCAELAATGLAPQLHLHILLRPMFLELLLRLENIE